jgi:alginate O-acetyltransferase complex protein AlgI
VFLIIERIGIGRWVEEKLGPLRHAYVLVVVMVGWVFFNARTLSQAVTYLQAMFGLGHGSWLEYNVALYLNSAVILAMFAGVVGSMPVVPFVRAAWDRAAVRGAESGKLLPDALGRAAGVAILVLIYVGCTMMSAHGSYSPFIYYRF